ncbi:BREX system ATP-binding domain-containing protein [Fundicoccus culcitae]|uniref:ATP-binding protein n=1 Tax=Fundicoccus culcitae TaxID=2969821 RepID=A0ABY5P8I4_9LACT|nr:BREX system ATP-binding domain-containing protein [Fundicoccus culcitae]UUX34678.1 ATP-binding protein [Fundicoccus culcitae]
MAVNRKDADSIVKALEAGVVPKRGIQYLLVGRRHEVEEVIRILESVSQGRSDLRIWVGDFGSGKSFMLQTIQNLAQQKNFVASTVDLTPNRRLYATDGSANALYTEIMDKLVTKSAQNGNVLNTIVEEWLTQIMQTLANKYHISQAEVLQEQYRLEIENTILDTFDKFQSVALSYEFGQAIIQYYRGLQQNNRQQMLQAIRWLRGDIRTMTESKQSLGINRVIRDDNWYDALKTMSELFIEIGYSGFVVNLDEAVNIYKLSNSVSRERNYERILNIYNECKADVARGLFVNLGATRKTVYNNLRGMASYGALQGRLGLEERMDSDLVNTNRTTLPLKPLTNEEIYTLLANLIHVYQVNYQTDITMSNEQIVQYMEIQLNRPGADEFLTPRAVIKDFIELLDLMRQNPGITASDALHDKFGDVAAPIQKDQANTDDDQIEVF